MAGQTHDEIIAEVEKIREISSRCRLITDMGDFAYIINATIPDTEIVIKIQIPGSFPSVAPVFIIRGLTAKLTQEILDVLTSEWDRTNRLSLAFTCAVTHVSELECVQTCPVTIKPKKKNAAKNKTSATSTEEKESSKKPSMRTASDVIKRIQWDGDLKSQDFTVGYIDRFIGIVEKRFDEFNWVDPAAADWMDLNVPEHRIEYFKYRGTIVWEKKSRTDNVFGSTGGSTISDVVTTEELQAIRKTSSSAEQEASASGNDSDQSQHDVQQDIPVQVQVNTPDSDNMERVRPTHFIAVPVTSGPAVCKAESTLAEVTKANPSVREHAIEAYNLHVTLCVLRIASPSDLAKVQKCLREHIKVLPKDSVLKFGVAGHFKEQVLYTSVEADQPFYTLFDKLMSSLADEGIQTFDRPTLTPHMTLVKIPWNVHKHTGLRVQLPSASDDDKVCQRISEVCLFSMERDDWGAYLTESSLEI